MTKTHQKSNTRPYNIWSSMKSRCSNPNNNAYDRYGGRGIDYCDRWEDFENFWEDMKEGYSDDREIDRIDNDGNYNPENCRWVTTKDQQNNRTNNHRITHKGKTQTISEWADELGIEMETIRARINQLGWTEERALSEDVREWGQWNPYQKSENVYRIPTRNGYKFSGKRKFPSEESCREAMEHVKNAMSSLPNTGDEAEISTPHGDYWIKKI